jgi:hypothetical protein
VWTQGKKKQKELLPLSVVYPQFLNLPVHNVVTIPTTLKQIIIERQHLNFRKFRTFQTLKNHFSQKNTCFSITKVSRLMPFNEIITVYFDHLTKSINLFCEHNLLLLEFKVGKKISTIVLERFYKDDRN